MGLSTFTNGGAVLHLRGLPWLALSGSGQIGTLGGSADAGGGASRTWTYGGTIPSRIDPLSGGQEEAADRIADRSTHTITLPPETPITVSSRFASLDENQTYEITAIRNLTAERVRVVEAVKLD